MKRRQFIFSSAVPVLTSLFPLRQLAAEEQAGAVGYVGDPVFLKYHLSPKHPESPDRYRYINQSMLDSGLLNKLERVPLKDNFESWLSSVHSQQHIRSIQQNYPDAYQVALAAVAAALAAVDRVASGELKRVFCASRPPGHHALNTGKEEGFCYFNQIAIAARYAQQQYGYKKVLIVDWDYHHGNSTEAFFYEDSSVLFFSTHDQFAYPGTGSPDRKGLGDGLGYNINVHLPCGTDDKTIVSVFNERLVPAVDTFKPELILISAGFDSRINDLLGCFEITDQGFQELTAILTDLADKHCQGRLISILEGGYNLQGNASAVVAHVSRLIEAS